MSLGGCDRRVDSNLDVRPAGTMALWSIPATSTQVAEPRLCSAALERPAAHILATPGIGAG